MDYAAELRFTVEAEGPEQLAADTDIHIGVRRHALSYDRLNPLIHNGKSSHLLLNRIAVRVEEVVRAELDAFLAEQAERRQKRLREEADRKATEINRSALRGEG